MTLLSAAMQHNVFKVNRVQKNLVARSERRLLDWLCARLPDWIVPDTLTLIGVFGAVLVFASYVASRWNSNFLWLASFGFVVHWFGDSLDGSLARHRRIERPIYGYFLDHTVDAICNLTIMVGLGLTRDVRMDVALFALIGYYLLCIYVFINNHLSGVFRLSFFGFGPTELRLALIGLNTAMLYYGHNVAFTVGGETWSLYDGLVMLIGISFTVVFVFQMLAGIQRLRDPSRSGPAAQAGLKAGVPKQVHKPSRNVSKAAK